MYHVHSALGQREIAKGGVQQRGAGSWELTIDASRDGLSKRRRRFETVRETKAQDQRRLRELLPGLDQGLHLRPNKLLLQD